MARDAVGHPVSDQQRRFLDRQTVERQIAQIGDRPAALAPAVDVVAGDTGNRQRRW
jgi:hypothetical protein